MKYQNFTVDGISIFKGVSKLYVASRGFKVFDNDPLINYCLVRCGLLVNSVKHLNKDSAIAQVHYINVDSLDKINEIDLMEHIEPPFKIRRIFKSVILPITKEPNHFLRRCAVNFLRLIKDEGMSVSIKVDGDRGKIVDSFLDMCFQELDLDPEGYKNIDFSPKGTVKFVIKKIDISNTHYSLVTYVEGKGWSN